MFFYYVLNYSWPADCTALGTAAMSQSAFEQSNADRNRLDRELLWYNFGIVLSLRLLYNLFFAFLGEY